MAISKRIHKAMGSASFIRKMFEAGRELKKIYGDNGVYDFSLGNPDVKPPQAFDTILMEEAVNQEPYIHGYMPNAGYPETREVLAERVSREQGIPVPAENVVVTCGAGGALNVVLKSLINPGDRIVAFTPCFMEYRYYADNHGASLDLISSRPDFDLDPEALEKTLEADCAAVLINSPNNPTGRIYPRETLERIGEVLERVSQRAGRRIYLISDEPYRLITYGKEVPPVFQCYEHSILCTSYSKELSIPGERIGYLAVHPQAESVNSLMDAAILCNRILGYVNAPALMQRVVARLEGLKNKPTVDIEIYRRRKDLLCEGLRRAGYDFQEPEGTFYLFVKAPGGDDLAFTEALRDQEQILVVPGTGFGAPGYFRISFCVNETVIQKALPGFEKILASFL